MWISHTQRPSVGLISQVANELWEVKNRKIRNLTREDITIVDYKKMLVRNSMSARTGLTHPLIYDHRFCRIGESQAVQQNRHQGQDMNTQDNSALAHPACRAPSRLLYGRHGLYMFRFHHHRLDCFNALVHVSYTKHRRRTCNTRISTPKTSITPTQWARRKGHSIIIFELPHEIFVTQNEILHFLCEDPPRFHKGNLRWDLQRGRCPSSSPSSNPVLACRTL